MLHENISPAIHLQIPRKIEKKQPCTLPSCQHRSIIERTHQVPRSTRLRRGNGIAAIARRNVSRERRSRADDRAACEKIRDGLPLPIWKSPGNRRLHGGVHRRRRVRAPRCWHKRQSSVPSGSRDDLSASGERPRPPLHRADNCAVRCTDCAATDRGLPLTSCPWPPDLLENAATRRGDGEQRMRRNTARGLLVDGVRVQSGLKIRPHCTILSVFENNCFTLIIYNI